MKTFSKIFVIASLALAVTFAATIEEAHARGRSGGSRGGSRGGFSRGGSRGGNRGGFSRGRSGGSRSGISNRSGSNRGGFNRGGFNRGGKSGGFHRGGSNNGHKPGQKQIGNRGGDRRIGDRFKKGGQTRDIRHRGGSEHGGKSKIGRHPGGHGHKHHGKKHGHWHHGHHHKGKGFGKWHGGHFGHHKHHHHHKHHGWGYHKRRFFAWGFGFYFSRPRYTYCNPYCVTNVVSVYDYTQPIAPIGDDPQTSDLGMNYFAAAREAFFQGDLRTALEQIDLAIKEMPSNPDVHQFRSLVLFSMKDYRQAAAAAHVALTAGPGWSWDTLKTLYPQAEIYTAQLRELEETRNQNKQDAAIRFLLAYHYLMLGHAESAVKELTVVVELEPRDQMAAKLLQSVTGKEIQPQQPAEYGQQVEQPQTSPQTGGGLGALSQAGLTAPAKTKEIADADVPPQTKKAPQQAKFVGEFKASPAEGVEFRLVLKDDQTFQWSFKADGNESSFEGTYTIADNELTLVRKEDSDKLIGTMTAIENGFNFKMKDGDPQDPGLDFTI